MTSHVEFDSSFDLSRPWPTGYHSANPLFLGMGTGKGALNSCARASSCGISTWRMRSPCLETPLSKERPPSLAGGTIETPALFSGAHIGLARAQALVTSYAEETLLSLGTCGGWGKPPSLERGSVVETFPRWAKTFSVRFRFWLTSAFSLKQTGYRHRGQHRHPCGGTTSFEGRCLWRRTSPWRRPSGASKPVPSRQKLGVHRQSKLADEVVRSYGRQQLPRCPRTI